MKKDYDKREVESNKWFKFLVLFLAILVLSFSVVSANETSNETSNETIMNPSTGFGGLLEIENTTQNTAILIFMTLLFIVLSFIKGFELFGGLGLLITGLVALFSSYPVIYGVLISILSIIIIFKE